MTWALLLPAAVFLFVFGWCILTAKDDPAEPPPADREVPHWKGGWRV